MAFGRAEGTSRWEGEQVTVKGPLEEAEEKAELSILLFFPPEQCQEERARRAQTKPPKRLIAGGAESGQPG